MVLLNGVLDASLNSNRNVIWATYEVSRIPRLTYVQASASGDVVPDHMHGSRTGDSCNTRVPPTQPLCPQLGYCGSVSLYLVSSTGAVCADGSRTIMWWLRLMLVGAVSLLLPRALAWAAAHTYARVHM